MDTDELSEMAYDIIIRAARVTDTLKAELGAMSSKYKSEEEWLRGVRNHLNEIINDPEEYAEYWNLQEEEGITPGKIKKLTENLLRISEIVLVTPIKERGARDW
jgi:RNA processing factor Prp31